MVKLDEEHDLALLKMQASPLPIVRLGNASIVSRQDPVWVFGFPFAEDLGQALTATSGYITAIFSKGNRRVMQLDAAVNPGNSGGPCR